MRRRGFITGIAGSAVAWPLSGRAQSSHQRLIGNLFAASMTSASPQINAILEGLRDLGYLQGRDFEMIHSPADGIMGRLPSLAEELIRRKPDVILANPTPAIVAARAFTKTIPIVSFMISNEIQLGLVASHARPGGNVTGLLMRVEGMVGKQLELAVQAIKGAKKIGVLFNSASVDASNDRREAELACQSLHIGCVFVDAQAPDQLDPMFQRFADERVGVVVVLYNSLFYQERQRIAALAMIRRIPVIFAARDHVVEGGLMSYGISLSASARRMTIFVDKILKGAQPGDLPLEFPSKLELVINLKTAKALGLDLPDTLLVRADEVIE
jgi:putative ABC transport system substrate-binding protein